MKEFTLGGQYMVTPNIILQASRPNVCTFLFRWFFSTRIIAHKPCEIYGRTSSSGNFRTLTQFKFMVRIPCSVISNPKPSYLLQYGHGLFGTLLMFSNSLGLRTEVKDDFIGKMADKNGWIVFSAGIKWCY